jgi:hypothetical protein
VAGKVPAARLNVLVRGSEVSEKSPRVSIIIPSFDGYRGGLLPRLLEDLEKQTFSDY